MKRIRIFLVGLVLLALLGMAWLWKGYEGEILTSYTFVEIDAPADKAWAALTDIASYPEWNPYVAKATGTLKVGERLKIVEQTDGRSRSHGVTVTRFDPQERQLIWVGATVPAVLFKWEEWFGIEPIDANHSRLTIANSNQGLLAQLYWKYNKHRDLQAYRQFGVAFKKKVEQ